MIRITLLACCIITSFFLQAQDFTGDHLCSILGKSVHSNEFKKFREFWLLDRQLSNTYGGILIKENSRDERVDTIIVAGYDYKNFNHYTSKLPFSISLLDGFSTVASKMNCTVTDDGNDKLYQIAGLSVLIGYNSDNQIKWLKFFKNDKTNIVVSPVNVPKKESKDAANLPDKIISNKNQLKEVYSLASSGSFKSAILQVFEVYRGNGLSTLKSKDLMFSNFWNYKYCYSTSLKIPGEKFNMLYSYPFITSQLDFVSVIVESDVADSAFKKAYKDAEKRLSDSFRSSEGWNSVCLPNKESSLLPDLEFKNEQLGSIILDYSRNPKGKHILFLRFLFYSN
ncbi:MAG: hypothetical protein IPH78_05575 [Bacteroidetes bacterium]|nr:hypothetical protein [Bacteroidota bacterium]